MSRRPPYLLAEQRGHAGLGGVADGGEVVTPLQSQDHPASGEGHQLLGQIAKT